MYSIVVFPDENVVEGVPTSWIKYDGECQFCCWPDKPSEIPKLIKRGTSPECFSWNQTKCVVKFTADNYKLMVEKRKLAEYLTTEMPSSDSDEIVSVKKLKRSLPHPEVDGVTPMIYPAPPKKKLLHTYVSKPADRNPPQKVQSSMKHRAGKTHHRGSISATLISSEEEELQSPPPKRRELLQSVSKSADRNPPQKVQSSIKHRDGKPHHKGSISAALISSEEEELQSPPPKRRELLQSESSSRSLESSSTQLAQVSHHSALVTDTDSDHKADEAKFRKEVKVMIRVGFENVYTQQQKIIEEIKILRRNQRVRSAAEPSLLAESSLPPLPINNEETMAMFEELLQSEDERINLVASLSVVVATSARSYITNVMNHVLTREYATLYSLHGKSGKRCFKESSVFKCTLEAIKKNYLCKDTKHEEIMSLIGFNLAHATDRVKKMRKKNEQEAENLDEIDSNNLDN